MRRRILRGSVTPVSGVGNFPVNSGTHDRVGGEGSKWVSVGSRSVWADELSRGEFGKRTGKTPRKTDPTGTEDGWTF